MRSLQPAPVDAGLEDAERPGDLPRAAGADPRVHVGDRGRRREGVRPHREDGHRGAPQPAEEALHLGRRPEPAGEDDPGDPRVRRGRVGQQRPDRDVGAVAGGDDQAALLQVVQEVGQLHRRHLEAQHLPVEPLRVPVQHLGAERLPDLADRGLVEEGVGGEDEHRRLAGHAAAEPCGSLGHGVGRNPVDDHREQVALLLREGIRQHAHGVGDLPGGPPLPGDDGQQRRAQVPRHLDVELELHRGVQGPIVGARADDEVALQRETPVTLEDPAVQLLLPASGEQLPRDVAADAGRAHERGRGPVPARDEGRQPVGGRRVPDEGAEEAHLPPVPREKLHHAEHDEGLPAAGPGPADVDAVRHQPPPPGL